MTPTPISDLRQAFVRAQERLGQQSQDAQHLSTLLAEERARPAAAGDPGKMKAQQDMAAAEEEVSAQLCISLSNPMLRPVGTVSCMPDGDAHPSTKVHPWPARMSHYVATEV